jgi:hypothetical protein
MSKGIDAIPDCRIQYGGSHVGCPQLELLRKGLFARSLGIGHWNPRFSIEVLSDPRFI